MAKLKDGFYKLTAEDVGSDSYMLLAGGGSKALSDFATASGVVTALGTNGNYVTWTKNGTVNNLTVPYATLADSANKLITRFSFGGGEHKDEYFYVGSITLKLAWLGYHSIWSFTGGETAWSGLLYIGFRATSNTKGFAGVTLEWLSLTDSQFDNSVHLTYTDTTETTDGVTKDVRICRIYIKLPSNYKSTFVSVIFESGTLKYSTSLVSTYEGTLLGTSTGNKATNATNIYVSQHTGNNIEYPLVWSNQANSNSALGNQLYKSYSHLTYNPGLLRITAGHLKTGSLFVDTGDSTLKIYSGRTTDSVDDGYICMQTCIDGVDGQTHEYAPKHQTREAILLQPRGGKVGIGTTNPKSRLSVMAHCSTTPTLGNLSNTGTVEIGTVGSYGTYLWTDGSGKGFIQQGRADGTATAYDLILQPLGKNVGIGTTNPTSVLDVVGEVAANYYKYNSYGSRLPHSSGDAWYNVYQEDIRTAGDTIILNLSHAYHHTDTDAVSLAITVGYDNAYISQISATGGSGIFKKVRVRFDHVTVWIDVLIYSRVANTDVIYVSGLGKGNFKTPTATSDSSNTKAELGIVTIGFYAPTAKIDTLNNGTPITSANIGSQSVNYATTAAKLETARTLTVGNSAKTFDGSANVSWPLHDILYNTTTINSSTSWDIYTPGVYYVASNSAFTGTNNPEAANGGTTPYRYGLLIVSRANTGGVAQFYVSHNDSSTSSSYTYTGIKFRTGWNNTYLSSWRTLLDTHNYSSVLDTRYYTETEINTKLGDYVTLATAQNITGAKRFNKQLTVYTSVSSQTPKIVFDEHYGPNWVSEIISDYYGNKVCTTDGFTHGFYIVLGRENPFGNLNILDSTKTPIARISKDRGHWFDGTLTASGNVTSTGFVKSGSSDSYVLLGGGSHKALSDFFIKPSKTYSSLNGLPSGTEGWYKVGRISDSSGSGCIFMVRAYAHSSAIFTVSKGYSTTGNITVLQYCSSGNGGYAYVKGARLISDGTVELLLNKPTSNNQNYVLISVATYNADNVRPFDTLTLDDGSPEVIQTKYFTNDAITATNFVGDLSGNATTATEARTLCTDATMKLYAERNNEVNFGGSSSSDTIYFGYRATDSKPVPTKFVFGSNTGTASLVAKQAILSSTVESNRYNLRYNGSEGLYGYFIINTRGTACTTEGTAGTTGITLLSLGNDKAVSTTKDAGAENAQGILRLYGTNTGFVNIRCGTHTTNNYNLYLPGDNGLFVYHTNDTAIGGSTTPVYVTSGGKVTACTAYSGLLTDLSSSSSTNISITVGGTTKTITDMWATNVANKYSSRPTTIAPGVTGDGGMFQFKCTSSVTDTATDPGDGHILHFNWDTTGGWDAQLFLSTSSSALKVRGMNLGTWQSWATVLTNLNSSVSGGGSSGGSSITVNIGGTSKTLTIPTSLPANGGNASTAAKLTTARKLWGNSFDGSADVNGNLRMGSSGAGLHYKAKSGDWSYFPFFLHNAADSAVLFRATFVGKDDSLSYFSLGPTLSSFTITNKSLVGIGTTSPTEKLHVNGLVNIEANSGILTIGCLNTSYTHYSTTGGTHWFNKAVEVNGSLTPHADVSFNIGSTSKRWSTIYGVNGNFSGTIKMYTGDSALAIYSGRITDAKSDGNICFLTSIDNTDPQSHAYPTQHGARCNIVLQPRGGLVYIGTNPDGGDATYKLYVNGKAFSKGLDIDSGSDAKIILNNTDTETKYQFISFRQEGTEYGYLGTLGDDVLKWSGNTILHSGNSSVSKSGQTLTVKINGVTQSLTNTTYSSLKNPNAIKFKKTDGTTVTYDGSSAADLTDGVNYATTAGTATTISGFTKRATANCTWGTLTASNEYTPVYWGNTASGGGIGFSDKGGKTYMQIDGDYYAQEGTKLVLHTGNSAVSGGGSNWGSSITVNIGGTSKTLTIPSNPNTDTKVTQTVTSSNATYPLLLAPSGQTATTTTSAYFDSGVTLNPSTNTITANISGSSDYLKILDVRDTDHLPNSTTYPEKNITAWFNLTGTPTNSWWSGITVKGWSNAYSVWLLCSYSGVGTDNDYRLYHRNGINDTWGSWKAVAYTSDIPSVGNGTVTIKQGGTTKGSFTMNQSGNTTIELTDTDTNTDTKVTQTNTTGNSTYRVLLSGSNNDTTETTTARKSTKLLFNTNSGKMDLSGSFLITTSIADHNSPTAQCLVINSTAAPSGTTLSLKNSPGIGFHISNTSWASLVWGPGGFNFINSDANGYQLVNASMIKCISNDKYISITPANSSYIHYTTDATIGHYFNTTVHVNGAVAPYGNNSFTSGTTSYRWSNVYAVNGNFSGQITSSIATGTSPFKITSTTVNTNLNADMLDGYHIWTGTRTQYNSATKNNNTIYLIYS